MPEAACMFDILALPNDHLRRVLPRASTRSLAKLLVAYPRTVGRTFLDVLTECTSAPTVRFLQEEMNVMRTPSFPEIRQAESELLKIIHDDNLSLASSSPHATALAQ